MPVASYRPHTPRRNCHEAGFQKIANRITLGLLLAALIVGAAMLVQVETSFRLWGYPGLAIIFFLLAAGGGVALMITILMGDE